MVTDEPDALFPVAAVPAPPPGQVAATFRRLVAAAIEQGKLVPEVDGALVEGCAVLAESLDAAQRIGGLKGGYLAAQAFPPFQRGLHALRLPVELTAATPPTPAPDGQGDVPTWLRDAFGTAESTGE